jgi:hypothetical protein
MLNYISSSANKLPKWFVSIGFSFDKLSKWATSNGYLMNMLSGWVTSSGSSGKKSFGLAKIG